MPASTFTHFRAELAALRQALSDVRGKTVRNEDLRERFRNLFRVWFSVVRPAIQPLLDNKRDMHKLAAELETLAGLTSKIRPLAEYRKRLGRAMVLANALVLFLPPSQSSYGSPLAPVRDEPFIQGIPDLPVRLVPNALLGWRSEIERFVSKYSFDRSVFLMIRYRKRNDALIRSLKATLRKARLNGILASEHKITDDIYNPVACLLCCSKGIAVFDRPEPKQVFNPNVAYELGMMHLLGRDCLILKHSTLTVLHTDINMKVYKEYRSVVGAEREVQTWVNAEG